MVATIKFVEIPHRRHVIGQTSFHSTQALNQTKPSTIPFTSSLRVALRIGGNIFRLTPPLLVVNIVQIMYSMCRQYPWSEVWRITSWTAEVFLL